VSANGVNINGWFHTDPSSPYPSTYSDFPEDTHDWTCAQWRIYYDRNKAIAGKAKAVEIIYIDLENQGSFSDAHWCKYDCDFMQYLLNEGVPIANIFTDIACVLSNTTGAISDTTTAVSKTVKTVSNILPFAVILGGGYFLFKYLNKK